MYYRIPYDKIKDTKDGFVCEGYMEAGNNQKLKILYLMKILLEKTDESHSITMPQILTELKARSEERRVGKEC